MIAFLYGKKTYLCGAALIIAAGCHALGYISDDAYTLLQGLFGGSGLLALRAAVAKH